MLQLGVRYLAHRNSTNISFLCDYIYTTKTIMLYEERGYSTAHMHKHIYALENVI